MSFIDRFTAQLPFLSKPPQVEYFFALNIGSEILGVAVWAIDSGKLKVINHVFSEYSGVEELISITDKLLDQVLGDSNLEPQKILFGVPDSWLADDNLKDSQLKILRSLVKELELQPLAYVATSQALTHYLENRDGAPTTAILIGINKKSVNVTLSRAGKLDGTKVVPRGDNLGEDIQKGLLLFSEVEVLPSRILIYGNKDMEKHKSQLLPFPWMAQLSFLHFPKIDVLDGDIEIKSITFAGAVEIDSNIKLETTIPVETSNLNTFKVEEKTVKKKDLASNDPGFIAGDVLDRQVSEPQLEDGRPVDETDEYIGELEDNETPINRYTELSPRLEVDPAQSVVVSPDKELVGSKNKGKFLGKLPVLNLTLRAKKILILPVLVLVILLVAYLTLIKATVIVYVEPRILEKDTQVTADPKVSQVDEQNKIIPGEIVEVQVSGTDKSPVTGKKQVGDPAKGQVTIYNKINESKTFSKGTSLVGPGGLKFILDTSVTIASQSAVEGGISFGKNSVGVTASDIGADGNLPSGSEMIVSNLATSQVSAKAEGNFSGGTSKEVTVVTDADQKKLLAQLSGVLRTQAQGELQQKLEGKKILEEALLEEIVKKSYNKNINDSASEVALSLTIKYKGTAYQDQDLKTIVSKLVTTEVPGDFELNLGETETLADVSKLEKDGRLIFLARFRAKLVPKIDTEKLKKDLIGKTPSQVSEALKKNDNILGSEVKMEPSLPSFLQRLPLLPGNIKVEVSLK